MKWISVKDRVPLDYEGYHPESNSYEHCNYDCCLVKGGEFGMVTSIARWDIIDKKWEILGNSGGYSDLGFIELDSEEVTHWIYLDDVLENIKDSK